MHSVMSSRIERNIANVSALCREKTEQAKAQRAKSIKWSKLGVIAKAKQIP